MTSRPPSEDAFFVEFSVDVTRQLATLPMEETRGIEQALNTLARVAPMLPIPNPVLMRRAGLENSGVHLGVGRWALSYEVSPLRRTVTLLELLARSGAASEGSDAG